MTRNLKRQWAEKRADGKRWYMGRVIRDFDRCPMPTCRSLDVTRWEDCARCNDCYTWIEYR